MTTEYLKASIIDCFKKYETELLLECIMIADYPVPFINTGFEYDGNLVIVIYTVPLRRFTKLVYGSLKIEL